MSLRQVPEKRQHCLHAFDLQNQLPRTVRGNTIALSQDVFARIYGLHLLGSLKQPYAIQRSASQAAAGHCSFPG